MQFQDLDMESLRDALPSLGGPILGLILVALAYLGLARVLKLLETRSVLRGRIVGLSRRILRWLAALAAVVVLLSSAGLLENAWTTVTAVLAMVAIGFVAVWSVLSNVLCAMIMLVLRPFDVGDGIEFPPDDIGGDVVNFNMLFTTLRADDGRLIQVPNNMFYQRVIRRRRGRASVRLDEQLFEERNAATRKPGTAIDEAKRPAASAAEREADRGHATSATTGR